MRLEKGLQSSSKSSAYKMRQSKTLLANFTFQDESEGDVCDDDEDSLVSTCSSISSSTAQSSSQMASWENIELTIDKETGRIEMVNKVKKEESNRTVKEANEVNESHEAHEVNDVDKDDDAKVNKIHTNEVGEQGI